MTNATIDFAHSGATDILRNAARDAYIAHEMSADQFAACLEDIYVIEHRSH